MEDEQLQKEAENLASGARLQVEGASQRLQTGEAEALAKLLFCLSLRCETAKRGAMWRIRPEAGGLALAPPLVPLFEWIVLSLGEFDWRQVYFSKVKAGVFVPARTVFDGAAEFWVPIKLRGVGRGVKVLVYVCGSRRRTKSSSEGCRRGSLGTEQAVDEESDTGQVCGAPRVPERRGFLKLHRISQRARPRFKERQGSTLPGAWLVGYRAGLEEPRPAFGRRRPEAGEGEIRTLNPTGFKSPLLPKEQITQRKRPPCPARIRYVLMCTPLRSWS
ncbi:hypothetical protein ACSSS7_004964 [Eimeria intestinalis]